MALRFSYRKVSGAFGKAFISYSFFFFYHCVRAPLAQEGLFYATDFLASELFFSPPHCVRTLV